MGASWDVFYCFLERVLGTNNGNGNGNGNGSDKSGDELVDNVKKENNNDYDNDNNNHNEKMTDPSLPPIEQKPSTTSTDTISVSSLLTDTVPLLEKSKSITLASFYSLVTHAYYRIEPFVHRVNFEFTDQQRKVLWLLS